jgi:futalosine hydrolase
VNPKSTLKSVKSITVNTVHGNAQSISEIVERENTDIESMEGAAVFNVCEYFNTNCIQIRSISNKVETRNKDNWDIKTAISNLNNEVERIITNL